MSKSKMQQLVEMVAEDQAKTYEYLAKISTFIEQLCEQLADNFGCSLADLSFITSEGDISRAEDSITIKDNGLFDFWLLIKIPVQAFNRNTCGQSFIEKSLAPPSGVVLPMTVKQHENLFMVEVSGKSQKASFEIDPNVDSSWIDLLEYCFVSTKAMLEGGLERRISALGTLRDNPSKRDFGFVWGEKE
ncbi:hypothetical protein [Microcoleus sp. B7-D4]|uniref:hypothetical protein n=1 Tax=Microcoleus sp. B7-D4 TaxID=2818696 RepID=UPI002FD7764C